MNNFYSDAELGNLFGLRPEGISIFEPMELGWLCPINKQHEITWSEFNDHIWCYQCKKDYFTLLCPKEMNPCTTPEIVKKETANVADEMSEWTLDKYQTLKNKRKK